MNIAQGPGGDLFGLSQDLWKGVALDRIFASKDRSVGWGVYDDFSNYGYTAALQTSLGLYASEGNQYRTFEYKGGAAVQSIIPDTTGIYTVPSGFPIPYNFSPSSNLAGTWAAAGSIFPTPGQLTFSPISSSNDQAQIQMGGSTAALNSLPFTPYAASNMLVGDVLFECRLRFSATLTAKNNFFIGLAGAGCGVSAMPVGAAYYGNSLATSGCSLLGFGFLYGDTTNTLSLVCAKNGGAASHQSISNMAGMNVLTFLAGSGDTTKTYANIGNGTYFKLGFRYGAASGTLTPYINGVALDGRIAPNKVIGNGLLSTNLGTAAPGTTSTTLWPADPMTLAAGLFNYNGSAQTMTLDWWAACQLTDPRN